MKRELVATADGSHTLYVEELGEHYHSIHGAVQESMHVFIEHGLKAIKQEPLHIFEMGMGTGLNLLLTALNQAGRNITYTTVEAYPLTLEEAEALNYSAVLPAEETEALLRSIHLTEWNMPFILKPDFVVTKFNQKLDELETDGLPPINLVYYDAFAPDAQPELWTVAVFHKLYALMAEGGMLVTYCAKGEVKRNVKSAGFILEALPGPPGKREMTRAIKPMLS